MDNGIPNARSDIASPRGDWRSPSTDSVSERAVQPFPMEDGDWWGGRERFGPRVLHRLSTPTHVTVGPDPLFDEIADVVIATGLFTLGMGIVAVLLP